MYAMAHPLSGCFNAAHGVADAILLVLGMPEKQQVSLSNPFDSFFGRKTAAGFTLILLDIL